MNKKLWTVILGAILWGCNMSTSEERIDNLNGYWEIQRAELPEGISKEFRFSELVDYIEVDSTSGFRAKVRPQLDGTFIATEDVELFDIKVENDSIHLYYATPFAKWKETLLSSSEDKLILLNPEGIKYEYKRFTPYSIDHGKEK